MSEISQLPVMLASGTFFSFLHPWMLVALLGLPLLALLKGRLGGTPGILFSSTQLVVAIGKKPRAKAGKVLLSLVYAAMALFIIALARPQLGKTLEHVTASGVDIMLVLDVSGSMRAEDYVVGDQLSLIHV